jgi:hypothetical protein
MALSRIKYSGRKTEQCRVTLDGGDPKLRLAAAGHRLSGKSGLVIAPAAVPAPFAASSTTGPSTAAAPIAARSAASS